MPGHFHDEFNEIEKVIKTTGQVVGSGIQSADSFIDNNIPGGERWTQGVSNITQGLAGAANEFTEITDRAVTDPIQSPGDAALFVVGSVRKGIEDFRYGARAASEAAGFDPRTGDALTLVAEEIATLGAGKLGKTISKLPPPSAPKLVPALAAVQQQTRAKYFGSAIPKGGQVLEAASTLPTPSNWQNRARDLYGQQRHRELADTFRRGQGGNLSKKNTFINADELALNKGGVLDQQLERADRMEGLRTKWSKTGKQIKGDRQRELYDASSLNPNHQDIEMYSSDTARAVSYTHLRAHET